MPRPKKPGAPEPKKRSRTGCWPCKTRKIKCDEEKPICVACRKQGEQCDYSIRLNWEGRGKKKADEASSVFQQMVLSSSTFQSSPVVNQVAETGSHPVATLLPDDVAGHDSPPSTLLSEPNKYVKLEAILAQSGSPSASYPATSFHPARPDHQHIQSYERYQSFTPNTQVPASLPAVSRLRNPAQQDSVSSPTDSVRSTTSSTFSTRTIPLPSLSSASSTPPSYGESNDPGDEDTVSCSRASKRHQNQRPGSSHGSRMLPPWSTLGPRSSEAQSSHTRGSPIFNSMILPALYQTGDGVNGNGPKFLPEITHTSSPDLRRLSVSSLLSGPTTPPSRTNSNTEIQYLPDGPEDDNQDTHIWGVDRGIKDLDVGRNDDMNSITGSSPISLRAHLDLVMNGDEGINPSEFGFGMESDYTAFDRGSYYDQPVPISIPRALEPLPKMLTENPMNLLYFHHFLNHTAGCLIPHNCSSNPFRSILPQMAVQDENLLNLLLAYSASHRARLLRQPEPATRIALWVQDIFPNLRKAMDIPGEIISNANLATAIMLASLEIISPKAFGVAVPWQTHLDTARQIIAARGGPQGMQTASRGDKVSSFLWSWFAYLDVLGSLSGPSSYSSSWILDYEVDGEDDYHIDCILGFTSRCVRILAKIAELAKLCDSQRIGLDRQAGLAWKPSEDTVSRAEKLEADLAESRLHPSKPCTHMQSTGKASYEWDSIEMAATNEAFHWAGLVHLHRRVLGKGSINNDVQNAVCEIHKGLSKVRRGSSAEACLLFPMFTAGCDTQDEKLRADILERMKGVERFGMTQVRKARNLMERAWYTGKPWETLVAGEFFG